MSMSTKCSIDAPRVRESMPPKTHSKPPFTKFILWAQTPQKSGSPYPLTSNKSMARLGYVEVHQASCGSHTYDHYLTLSGVSSHLKKCSLYIYRLYLYSNPLYAKTNRNILVHHWASFRHSFTTHPAQPHLFRAAPAAMAGRLASIMSPERSAVRNANTGWKSKQSCWNKST